MEISAKGLAILPTRGRAATKLPEFFEAAKKTGMTIPGAVVVDEDDYAENKGDYDSLALPDNWFIHRVKGGSCAASTKEALADLFTDDMEYLFWLADDLRPETPAWDTRVVEGLTGWNCVSTNDGMHAPRKFNGATAWSGDLVRSVGHLFPTDLGHYFVDDQWEELGKLTGCWHVLMDVMVRHAHASWTNSRDATTDHTNSFLDQDERGFTDWKMNHAIKEADRIFELMGTKGVKIVRPDLSGVRLMLATPCGDGRFDHLYVTALLNTMTSLRQYGAIVHWAQMPYVSDVALARNRIFGTFMRSTYTHLMQIDDDMGWRPQDVVGLLLAKRDFISAAGPMKVKKPSFAAAMNDDWGNPTPLRMEPETGIAEASEVGAAFSLISRSCGERMAAAYPDLAYTGTDGRKETAVYLPMIVNGRYFSEDFSFCYRWRKIGGKVHVMVDVPLDHVGVSVWSGKWSDQLFAPQMQMAAE